MGTTAYVLMVGGLVWGAYASFDAVTGMPLKASTQEVAKMGPIQRISGKWTPVEIKREAAAPVAPPLPPYVAPRTMATNAAVATKQPIMVAERKPTKKVVIVRRAYAPEERQVFASYAAPEPPRFFGPFRFGF
jgi:hypothetical protein